MYIFLNNQLPLKTGFLFSINAAVPSFLSSEANTFPNNLISSLKPFLSKS
jgi:hypothetical protein